MSERKIARSTAWSAGAGCHGGCGVLAHIEDGRLAKIEGDPDHPRNQAADFAKGRTKQGDVHFAST